MSSLRALALAGGLLSIALSGGCSRSAPDGASDAQVATYQGNVFANCKDEGRRTGHDPWQVEVFCDCMLKVLKTEVAPQDWRHAAQFALAGKHDLEHAVFVKKLDKVEVCRVQDPATKL